MNNEHYNNEHYNNEHYNNEHYWALAGDRAIEQGRHIPHEWYFEFDEGGDCMPRGYYAVGCDKNGNSIDWPIRHEYGPYETLFDCFKEIGEALLNNDDYAGRPLNC